MKCGTSLTCCIVSRAVHLLMTLMKLVVLLASISVDILLMLSVEAVKVVKVERRHIKVFKTECRASWEVSTSSAVKEK